MLHQELPFNIQLAVSEVLDDYWASYLCLLNGFTKQSQQLLRNTLELVIQMFYLAELYQTSGLSRDGWTDATRGIERIPDKLKSVKNSLEAIQKGTTSRLSHLYDSLCMSTHSHKRRMAALRMPRMMRAGDMPSFEPAEILYSRALFFSVLELELRLMRSIITTWSEDYWHAQVKGVFDKMLHLISKYERVIVLFHKGYLIHREYAKLSDGNQILYSIKLNGEGEFPSRKRLITNAQAKELRRYIEIRLLQDRT
ncbi:MAG TPA: hypothetical protein VF746_02090 [Longimicrobium sp.]|jgi:hypothetical protein